MIASKKIRVIMATLVLAFTFALSFSPAMAATDILGPACQQAPNSPICNQAAQQYTSNKNPVVEDIRTAANIVAALTGVGAIVMIIISGLTFVTAGGVGFKTATGNATAAARARARLLYSVVGLVVVALAWTITRFITDRVIQ